ncbi:hypothetical protein B9Z55_012699 [Caenorhabditis nigoni]|uniref:Uncharacterized protein n=1 Tax=Caenorhabditis nigoni TaxID=1611254 RepID=A0A2G5TZG5_9PELO|nr:hypothetical protein B9Z55_012699 [Caenorhabditis nigoni]
MCFVSVFTKNSSNFAKIYLFWVFLPRILSFFTIFSRVRAVLSSYFVGRLNMLVFRRNICDFDCRCQMRRFFDGTLPKTPSDIDLEQS